jgi:hypothetical protein
MFARYRYGLKQSWVLRFRFGGIFAHAPCWLCAGAMLALTSTITPTIAQKAYGPGVSDTEIKIGTTTPFSGPASPIRQEHIMNKATHLDMELPLLLPGISLKTSPDDHRPIKQMNLVQFDGERYVLFGNIISSE